MLGAARLLSYLDTAISLDSLRLDAVKKTFEMNLSFPVEEKSMGILVNPLEPCASQIQFFTDVRQKKRHVRKAIKTNSYMDMVAANYTHAHAVQYYTTPCAGQQSKMDRRKKSDKWKLTISSRLRRSLVTICA